MDLTLFPAGFCISGEQRLLAVLTLSFPFTKISPLNKLFKLSCFSASRFHENALALPSKISLSWTLNPSSHGITDALVNMIYTVNVSVIWCHHGEPETSQTTCIHLLTLTLGCCVTGSKFPNFHVSVSSCIKGWKWHCVPDGKSV